MVTLADFCVYARTSVQDDAEIIQGLIDSADALVRDKTGKLRPAESDALYDLCVKMLAAHWYDNRTPTDTLKREIPYTVTMLLNHIALCLRYPEVKADEPDE